VKEGSILFIPSNCLHSFTGQPNVPFHFFAIVFHPALLNSFVNDVIQQRYIDSVSHGRVLFPEHILPMEEWEQRVHRLLLDIRDCFRQKETAFELLIKIRLYAVWYLMYTHADTSAAGPAECSGQGVAAVRSVIEYIRAHYESPVTLPELSRAFHISEGHLCRLFKSVTGMSITEYVNYFRISIAASLLLDTHADVGEIAGMAGFNSISYFNKVFRKHLHMTPSKFRRSRPPEKGSTEWETHFISHGSRR
ncbi:MAG: AraC family transcriptional regulator, partial [Acetatifactor sp.]|nr:AraC family transcriptional regulator [Acetatifactor sp.]